MSLKTSIKDGLGKIGRLPVISTILFNPSIQSRLQRLPGMRFFYGVGWELLHPFDAVLGVDTSGYVPREKLAGSTFSTGEAFVYGGSQPSIIRAILKSLPNLEGATFVDFGTGKGRPVLVAAEFPFQEVIGVELSPALAEVAQKNVEITRARLPDRSPMRVVNGDAAAFPLPSGNLVIYLYNPFGAGVINQVIAHIEEAFRQEPRAIWIFYYNPVHGACFDASPIFQRYLARTIPYAEEERGFGPDDADPVVVWQAGAANPAEEGADAKINVVKPDFRSELVPSRREGRVVPVGPPGRD